MHFAPYLTEITLHDLKITCSFIFAQGVIILLLESVIVCRNDVLPMFEQLLLSLPSYITVTYNPSLSIHLVHVSVETFTP